MIIYNKWAGSLLLIGFCAGIGSVFAQPPKKAQKNWSLNDTIAYTSIQNALELYSAEENPYRRAKIVDEITAQADPARRLSNPEFQSLDKIIALGMEDEYPRVVAATARLISALKKSELEPALLSRFENAHALDPSYRNQIKVPIVYCLGSIGGRDSKELFKKLLSQEDDPPLSDAALHAIRQTRDPMLLTDVDVYASRMKAKLSRLSKDRDYDEYARVSRSVELATQVRTTLTAGKGE